jgi:hypothetical protein
MSVCPSCGSDHYFNFACEHCKYNPITGRTPNIEQKKDHVIFIMLERIADSLEKIERHMAYNNGTLEGLTRNYDPRMSR